MRILHLEDDSSDAYLVRRTIQGSSLNASLTLVTSRDAFLTALEDDEWDVVVADNALPTFSSKDALAALRRRHPSTPFIVLSGAGEEEQIVQSLDDGVHDYILKDHLPQLVVSLHRIRLAQGGGSPRTPS